MNPLEKFKQQLMIKPILEDKKRVMVRIGVEEQPGNANEPTLVKEPTQLQNVQPTKVKQKKPLLIIEEDDTELMLSELDNKIQFIDETNKGYDRTELLKKLAQHNLLKVNVNPLLEIKPIEKKPETPEKVERVEKVEKVEKTGKTRKNIVKPKKLTKLLIIEDDEEPEPKEKEVKEPEPKEKEVKEPQENIIVLGPETSVKIGEIDISKRLPNKEKSIIISAPSYYMNNREKFINFINSLFLPYKKELESNAENITCETLNKEKNDFSLLTHQKIVRDYINLLTPFRGLLLYHGLGSGKCHKKDTPIILFDGHIKMVQDVVVGDSLMGDDSNPRTVLSLASGKDKMYEIISANGETYTVNSEHILCLKATGFPKYKHCKNNNIHIQWIENNCFKMKKFNENHQTNAKDFFDSILIDKNTNNNIIEISVNDYLKLSKHKKSLLKGYKTHIDFSEVELPEDPYNFGYNLEDNKVTQIPHIYKCNTRENRLKLLAGLLDRNIKSSSKKVFEYIHDDEILLNDVIYIVRSLGLSCIKMECINNTKWKIQINGNGITDIPIQMARKINKNHKNTDVLLTKIKVNYVNEDTYYGFTLDGNCRYLMGDFTVTHNTCSSIAIAEGMKNSKKIIVMTPASLVQNYMEQLKFCGDFLYKKNQYWEFISLTKNPEYLDGLSSVLNLPKEYIQKQKGAWFVNVQKPSNYEKLTENEKQAINKQLDKMIETKYTFIKYNGLRENKLKELTNNYKENLFDNAVIIIDEAHNLISRIVNKLKNITGKKSALNKSLSVKLYEYLLSAKNAKIIMLTGTPIVNYPNEFGIIFNILRGYIKTWEIPVNIKTSNKIDKNALQNILSTEKTLDYLDYSSSKKLITITRNPFGFKNKIKVGVGYQGVTNVVDEDIVTDEKFEKRIITILGKNDIEVIPSEIKVLNQKALPDNFDLFAEQYINSSTKELKNIDGLKRRIIGLSSYFKSAQEGLLPKYDKIINKDYHVFEIPMSDYQFKIYESARKDERKRDKSNKKKKNMGKDDAIDGIYSETTSTYRIFSRLFCNFVIPERPYPLHKREKKNEEEEDYTKILKDAEKEDDYSEINEGEQEGDEILDKIGGETYKEMIVTKTKFIKEHSDEFLTPLALQKYSPKFLRILNNILNKEYIGLHLVYSQFRTLEGITLFSLVLDKNGFTQFKIKKKNNIWEVDIPEEEQHKPTYALYTGTESVEEKEIIRNIYNGDWKYVPTSIVSYLKNKSENNIIGEVIKVFMITSSGSEGINLKNTRFVHIMEPYWHPVRVEQVIGRARRICSHKDLPIELQTVDVFIYLMKFTDEQLSSEYAVELTIEDISKIETSRGERNVITSDQYLYELSELKAKLSTQLIETIKETSFDCYIYSNGKCMSFGDPLSDKFSYVPNYANQQSDAIAQTNKQILEWEARKIEINGVNYAAKEINKKSYLLYDYNSYLQALKNPGENPVQVGKYEINNKGQGIFTTLVS